jgi:transcriptional regulator with PAS, ATPase and Fis domain
VEGVAQAALLKLMNYDWPGNVRELENILGRAMIFMNYYETFINIHHLPELRTKKTGTEPLVSDHSESIQQDRSLTVLVEEYESEIIQQTLRRFNGNKTATAKALGLSVRNLYYKLEKYKLENNSMQ